MAESLAMTLRLKLPPSRGPPAKVPHNAPHPIVARSGTHNGPAMSPMAQANRDMSPRTRGRNNMGMSPRGKRGSRGNNMSPRGYDNASMSPRARHNMPKLVEIVKQPISRGIRLLRGVVGMIGLGMMCASRSKGRITSKIAKSERSSGYQVNPNMFDTRNYVAGQEFKVFRVTVSADDTPGETVQVSFAMSPHKAYRWIITLMDMSHAKDLDQAFGAVPDREDGRQLVTAVYSVKDDKLLARSILCATNCMEEYPVIREFLRSVRAVDPNEYKDYMKNTPAEDANPYQIGSISLPTAQDLNNLPLEVTRTVQHIAMETLRQFLYPRALLWIRVRFRKRLMSIGVNLVPKVTLDIIMRQSMFKTWPQALLQDLLKMLEMISFDVNEFILHEDEQAGSGIYFLATGTVSVWKKLSRKKSIGADNTKKIVQLNAPMCFGEFAFLTEEPRLASVRANNRVDLWVLKKHDFHRLFARLPKSLLTSVIAIAFEKRNSNMHISYPMTIEFLRTFAMFKVCSDSVLESLRVKMTPYAVPKKHTIFKAGDHGKAMFFLRYGKCGEYKMIGKEDTHVSTLNTGELIGDDAVLYNGVQSVTIKTLSNCDLWALSKASFDAVMTTPLCFLDLDRMMAAARIWRQGKLGLQALRFREFIDFLPIVSSLVSKFAFKDLATAFEPKVYKPRHVICSTAHFADRIIVLTKGTIKIGDTEMWVHGECAGYTCIVPHRWSQTCMTAEIVEVLELPLAKYVDFLKRNSVYERMIELVTALLFPRASKQSSVMEALECTRNLKTAVLYPVSLSYRVNPCEYCFGVTPANEDGAVTAASGEARAQRILEHQSSTSPRPVVVTEDVPRKAFTYTNYRPSTGTPSSKAEVFVKRPMSSKGLEPLTSPPKVGTPAKVFSPANRMVFPSYTKGGVIIMKRKVV